MANTPEIDQLLSGMCVKILEEVFKDEERSKAIIAEVSKEIDKNLPKIIFERVRDLINNDGNIYEEMYEFTEKLVKSVLNEKLNNGKKAKR